MAYVTLQLAVTLDGFIAREDGSVDYLDSMTPEFTERFNQFVSSIDTIVMGSTTYLKMLEFGEIPFRNKDILVLTTKKRKTNEPHVTFTDAPLIDLVQEDRHIWLFGGSEVIHQFLTLDLIDEFQLFIVPHILGSGIPLFKESNGRSNLKLIETTQYGDNVYLVYVK